jgi:hypothetical protein
MRKRKLTGIPQRPPLVYLTRKQLNLVFGEPRERAVWRDDLEHRALSWPCSCKAIDTSSGRFLVTLCIEHIDAAAIEQSDYESL